MKGTAQAEHKRPRFSKLAIVFGSQALFLLLIYWLARAYAPPGTMVPLDAVAPAGGEARLAVRLEREYPFRGRRGIRGVEVEFEALPAAESPGGGPPSPQPAGKAPTDGEGVAALRLEAPGAAGTFRYRARVSSPAAPPLERTEADLVLQTVPEGGGVIVTLVTAVLGNDGRAESSPDPGLEETSGAAREALKDLSRSSALLYLLTLPGGAPSRLRARLEQAGFPPGAILFAPGASDWETLRDFLSRQELAAWKERAWGICASEEEAQGFQLSGFRAIILDEKGNRIPGGRKVFTARDWAEVKRIIAKNP